LQGNCICKSGFNPPVSEAIYSSKYQIHKNKHTDGSIVKENGKYKRSKLKNEYIAKASTIKKDMVSFQIIQCTIITAKNANNI